MVNPTRDKRTWAQHLPKGWDPPSGPTGKVINPFARAAAQAVAAGDWAGPKGSAVNTGVRIQEMKRRTPVRDYRAERKNMQKVMQKRERKGTS